MLFCLGDILVECAAKRDVYNLISTAYTKNRLALRHKALEKLKLNRITGNVDIARAVDLLTVSVWMNVTSAAEQKSIEIR